MSTDGIPLRVTIRRLFVAVQRINRSSDGRPARWMFAALVVLLCGANGLNVLNSYVGRDFMNAITDRNKSEFLWQAVLYIGVFAASTFVSVIARFFEERLALLWRAFMTRQAIGSYLADGTYQTLDVSGQLANPDQRISEDIKAFSATTLSFILMGLNSLLTILAFSGVLWTISPALFGVSVLYAAVGSVVTVAMGRSLVQLNSRQLDKEASFRSGLIHVRQNAELIYVGRSEGRHSERLLAKLSDLVDNFRTITSINRNVGFFTTGYNWLIQIIPALIVAPGYIAGQIEFGVITQSAMAFSTLVAAFSLIVTQFQSLSNFAAVVARLSSLMSAIEGSKGGPEAATIRTEVSTGRLAFESLTLLASADGGRVIEDLSLEIPRASRVLVGGVNTAAGVLLFRALAGLPCSGTGRIVRPDVERMAFLSQRPYLPPGELRRVIADGDVSDISRIQDLIGELKLQSTVSRVGGLEAEQDWQAALSLREQHVLAIARAIQRAPDFVVLDRLGAQLGRDQLALILRMFAERSIGYINIGEVGEPADLYDAKLACLEGGRWLWTDVRAAL